MACATTHRPAFVRAERGADERPSHWRCVRCTTILIGGSASRTRPARSCFRWTSAASGWLLPHTSIAVRRHRGPARRHLSALYRTSRTCAHARRRCRSGWRGSRRTRRADEASRHETVDQEAPPLLLWTACNSTVVAGVAKGREAASRAVERSPGPDRGLAIMLWPASGGSALRNTRRNQPESR